MLFCLVTDKSKVTEDRYLIPENITYSDLRVDRVILSNTWDNITGNSWKVTVGSTVKDVPIPDGRYSPSEYADYLEQYLTANTSDVMWFVTYNKNTSKFTIRGNNTGSDDAILEPNEAAQDISGFDASTTYGAGNHVGEDGNKISSFNPSYITIRSGDLNFNAYAYKRQTSDIICFFPLNTEATNSVFQETVDFTPVYNGKKNVTNEVDLKFYLDDKVQIKNPVFSMEVQFA